MVSTLTRILPWTVWWQKRWRRPLLQGRGPGRVPGIQNTRGFTSGMGTHRFFSEADAKVPNGRRIVLPIWTKTVVFIICAQ
jgi:hypothetical protein